MSKQAKSKDQQEYEDYVAYQEYLASQGESEPLLPEGTGGAVEKGFRALDYDRATTGGPLFAKALEKLTGKKIKTPAAGDVAKLKAGFPTSAEMLGQAGVPAGPSTVDATKNIPGFGDGIIQPGDPLDFTLRGLGGGILDIATAPSTYLSMGLSAAAKKAAAAGKNLPFFQRWGNRIFNPVESFFGARGDKLYKRAAVDLDAKALDRGKTLMPSKVLQNERFSGNMGAARDKLGAVNEAAGEKIGQILDEAAGKGAAVDMETVFAPALKEADKLDAMLSPEAHDLARSIRKRVKYMQDQMSTPERVRQLNDGPGVGAMVPDNLPSSTELPLRGTTQVTDNVPAFREQVQGVGTSKRALPPVSPGASGTFEVTPASGGKLRVDKANREKSFLDALVKDSGFDQGTQAALSTKEKKAVSGAIRKSIPEEVATVDPELASQLTKANELFSATDESIQKVARNKAKQKIEVNNPLMPSAADLMLAPLMGGIGYSAAGGQGLGLSLGVLGLKKLRDAARTTSGLTMRGKMATKLGNSKGLLDSSIRHGSQSPYSVWQAMQQEEEQ